MSPVSTATRASGGRISSVLSSSVVLPDPGELIRFTHSAPFRRKRSRNDAARRSFSLRTFFCKGTWLMLFHLQISQFQFVSADEACLQRSTLRTTKLVIVNCELFA